MQLLWISIDCFAKGSIELYCISRQECGCLHVSVVAVSVRIREPLLVDVTVGRPQQVRRDRSRQCCRTGGEPSADVNH